MKKISIWAKTNAGSARLTIILIHLALAILGVQAGRLLSQTDINISAETINLSLLVYILIFFVYPQYHGTRRLKSKKSFYRIQKTCDFLLAFGGFLFVSIFSKNFYSENENRVYLQLVSQVSASKSANPTAEEILQSLKYRSGKDLSRAEKKVLKHEFIKQVKVYVKAKAKGDSGTAGKAIGVVFVIAAAVGLTYLLSGLACSLSCSGAEGLALLVTIVGLSAIIFGSIVLVRAITHPKHKQPAVSDDKLD